MMLRPATPLTLFFLIAFVLLMLSTLSTPVIHNLPLASWDGYNFGVFGYCQINGVDTCTPAQVGYPLDGIFSTTDDFTLPSGSRHALSSILVVHPVAAFMTLICTLLAAASHFRGPSHSPRFLLALLILTFPTLLITLLAFLVDILLFIPHMAWGGWIVLAATIIITACSVLTCAMRRTLVSRKARKKRIAENSDMNGDNFYAMKQAPSGVARAESPPPMEHSQPKPAFATYEHNTARTSSDDRTPLNHKASSINTSSDSGPSRSQPSDVNNPANTNLAGSTAAPAVAAVASAGALNSTPDGYRYDPNPSSTITGDMTHPSERMRSDRGTPGEATRRGQMPQYRGGRGSSRGAPPYYGPGRDGMAPPQRGGPGMRGGYGPQQPYPTRGGYGPGPGPAPRGGFQNAPPPGWTSRGRGMPGGRGPPGYGPGPYGRSQPSSPQEYDTRSTPFPAAGTNPLPYPTSPDMPLSGPYSSTRSPYEAEQPQQDDAAAVIDAYGASPELPASTSFARRPSGGVERDPASFGFSGRRSPARGSRQPRDNSTVPPIPGQHSEGVTPDPAELDSAPLMAAPVVSELDSRPQTIPEMHGNPSTWNGQPVEIGQSSPRQSQHAFANEPQSSAPIELPGNENMPLASQTNPLIQTTSHTRSASENYYEDVPARFATDDPILPPKLQPLNTKPAGLNPTALHAISHSRYTGSAYEEAANPDRTEGSRSPAASETSNFTSISQRPVNPSWRPPPGPGPSMMGPGFMPGQGRGGYGPQSPQQRGYPGSSIYSGAPGKPPASRYRDQETVLNANPDFALPGAAGTPNRRKIPGAGARQSSGSMGSMMDRPRPRGMSGTGSAMGAGMSAGISPGMGGSNMGGQMGSPSQGGGSRYPGEF